MEVLKARINAKIAAKKVVVVSKRSCWYSTMAKDCFRKYIARKELPKTEYEVWEIEEEKSCSAIQTYLGRLTGARTVPRVFIDGKCVGGWTDVRFLDNKGELSRMLKELFGPSSEISDRKQTYKR